MIKALNAFFATFFTLFTAVNRIATASDNLAKVAEQASEDFYNQQKLEGAARTNELKQQLANLEATASTKTVDL
jgi:hypothetical protein